MTYRTKNTTFVIAFAAMMMAAPLSISSVYADPVAIVDAACGFDENEPPSIGSITRGAAENSISEVTATFTPKTGATGTGTIFVSADDWDGLGDRASGSFTIANDFVADTDSVDVNSLTYNAKNVEGTTSEFDTSGTSAETAASLARAINARDGANVRAYTNGGTTLTIEAEVRGSAVGQNDFTTSVSTTGSSTASTADLNGGGDNINPILAAENTKFDIVVDATSTPGGSTGTAYSAKTAMPEEGAAFDLEMITGTTTGENVEISFQINTAFINTAEADVTLSSVGAGETVTIRGITYTAVSGTPGALQFDISGTDTQAGDSLETIIESSDSLLDASNAAGVVTVSAATAGESGNAYTLIKSGAGITVESATLTGGTENMQNLPYEGSISQDLTFTIDCT